MRSCNKCGKLIKFEKSEEGRYYPVNEDGTEHTPKCKPDPKVMDFYKNNPEA